MDAPRRILVIRLREIGDTLLITPLLRQLKRIFPLASVDVVCESRNSAVLMHNPHIDRLRILNRQANPWQLLRFADELRRVRYDWVIDSQSMPKTAIVTGLTCARRRTGFRNRWLRHWPCYTSSLVKKRLNYCAVSNLELLQDPRVDLRDVRLEMFPDEAAMEAAKRIVGLAQGRPLVAINPVTRFEQRKWPAEGFAEIADRLTARGFQVIILYGPGELAVARQVADRARCRCIIDYPMPSLLELSSLLSLCRLYIGNDGGPKHLAVAAGIPTVTLFGHSPDPWTPWHDPMHRVVASALAGSTIRANGIVVREATSIQEISVERVWEVVQLALSHLRLAV